MFSKACEYALRATIYIAQKGEETRLGIPDIAEATDAPPPFIAKILQSLSKEGVVSSAKGPNGGFFITAKQKKLPVRSVLHALGEDMELEKCVLGLNQCSEKKPCPLHKEYKVIKINLIRLFETKTIQDLAADINNGTSFINNKATRIAR